jgi:mannose-6-phosphate isomerase-like protein (cupin superfamily)
MAVHHSNNVRVLRWHGAQHPTLSSISRLMNKENLTPYHAIHTPNSRQPVHSHGFKKIFYLVEGTMDITLPDSNITFSLRPGDRVEIPQGTVYGSIVGASGAKCLEAALRPSRANT